MAGGWSAILFIPNRLRETTTTTTWHQQARLCFASSNLWSIVILVAFNLPPNGEFWAQDSLAVGVPFNWSFCYVIGCNASPLLFIPPQNIICWWMSHQQIRIPQSSQRVTFCFVMEEQIEVDSIIIISSTSSSGYERSNYHVQASQSSLQQRYGLVMEWNLES